MRVETLKSAPISQVAFMRWVSTPSSLMREQPHPLFLMAISCLMSAHTYGVELPKEYRAEEALRPRLSPLLAQTCFDYPAMHAL